MDQAFYDVIVAGGGLAGVLAAGRLAAAEPGRRILLLERDSILGGRLRSTTRERGQYGYGLNALSAQLYSFIDQTLRTDPEAPLLEGLAPPRQQRMGVLAGNRILEADIGLFAQAKGARTLGGLAAARQWPEIEAILHPQRAGAVAAGPAMPVDSQAADSDEDGSAKVVKGASADAEDDDEADDRSHPFAHYWKKQRKAPAAIVLEHFASAFGIPDIWSASPQAIAERAEFHSSRLHGGSWDLVLLALTELPAFKANVTIMTSSVIGNASLDESEWKVETETGVYKSRALVVAQPPWQAITWLKRSLWPANVLQIPSKTKPVSVVTLAERLDPKVSATIQIPDVLIVPAERVQIVRNGPDDICFQATIDFELSLQAPAVVKAVRSLKRARKKLLTLHPGLVSEGNHLALQPVAWAQSPSHTDRRWLEKLEKKPFNTATLAFCGDAYGAHYDGDGNLMRSLLSACEAVTAGTDHRQ